MTFAALSPTPANTRRTRHTMPAPRVLDPQTAPVVGTDSHLLAVPVERLQPHALRQRFAARPVWTPEFDGDGRFESQRQPAAAAVLVALVQRADGLHVLLTRRTAHLRDHAGQISLPGGRSEVHDDGPAATALREAHEEVGLVPQLVEVLGTLPTYTTITQFVVTPVVALVPALDTQALPVDAFEVAEVFEVPLAFLMTPAHHQRHLFRHDGSERQFLSMPWQGPDADGVLREYFIWGATAAMLRNLYRFLAA
jgi:8-oxo-dGTP pyrophosphatase MutT (NUDIX family)